jgi:hypothetical protein
MENIVQYSIIAIVVIGTIFMVLAARKDLKTKSRKNSLREIRKQRELQGRRVKK